MLQMYFDIDALGVTNFVSSNPEILRALNILDKTSRRVGDTWEVGLLWKNDNFNFSDGKLNALHRLKLVERKLDQDKDYAEKYYREMNRLLDFGFAGVVNDASTHNKIRYLPHFGVQNVNKPGKVRIVFDAAAKVGTTSFNDLMLTGPDLLKPLLGVLMRFRQYKYAIKSDIKDMFMRIQIIPSDRDSKRFLWRGQDRQWPPKVYRMRVVLFGAKSSPSTAIYIKNKNALEFKDKFPLASQTIVDNSYMDDFLDSNTSAELASKIFDEVEWINKRTGFHMHGWASNEESILINKKSEERITVLNTELCEVDGEKVLGLKRLNISDKLLFMYNLNKISSDILEGWVKPTKSIFLGIIMYIFDPLGFLIPYTIEVRFLMQQIWASNIQSDQQIKDPEFKEWKYWIMNLKKMRSLEIDRCYQAKLQQQNRAELHVFCDASSKAFTAVAYWRFELNRDKYHVSLIIAKSRMVGLKSNVTIPRLELQAALLGIRLASTIGLEHEFDISRRYFWTDSKIELSWLKKDPIEFKIFVANRSGEIREKSNIGEWRWISSKENPADDATRFSPKALENDSRWLLGPNFFTETRTLMAKT